MTRYPAINYAGIHTQQSGKLAPRARSSTQPQRDLSQGIAVASQTKQQHAATSSNCINTAASYLDQAADPSLNYRIPISQSRPPSNETAADEHTIQKQKSSKRRAHSPVLSDPVCGGSIEDPHARGRIKRRSTNQPPPIIWDGITPIW